MAISLSGEPYDNAVHRLSCCGRSFFCSPSRSSSTGQFCAVEVDWWVIYLTQRYKFMAKLWRGRVTARGAGRVKGPCPPLLGAFSVVLVQAGSQRFQSRALGPRFRGGDEIGWMTGISHSLGGFPTFAKTMRTARLRRKKSYVAELIRYRSSPEIRVVCVKFSKLVTGESAFGCFRSIEQIPLFDRKRPSLRPDLPSGRAPRAAAVKGAAAKAAPAQPARSVPRFREGRLLTERARC